jgi:hypothetical protein
VAARRALLAALAGVIACGGDDGGATDGSPVDASAADAGFTPAAHAHYPPLVLGRGGVIASLRLVTIVPANAELADELFAFGDALVESDWLTAIGDEYGVGQGAAVAVTGPELVAAEPLDRAAVEAYIASAIEGDGSLAPDGRSVYALYLPAGVDLIGDEECSDGPDGHHAAFGELGDGFAVVPRCQGIFASALEQLTLIGSHEIAEAITDTTDGWHIERPPETPGWRWTASPWLGYNGPSNAYQPNVENADLCNGTRVVEGDFAYQRSFSNRAAAAGEDPCVPHLEVQYVGVSTASDWYEAEAGGAIEIPVGGWSSAPAEDWIVTQRRQGGTPGWTFAGRLSGPRTTTVEGTTFQLINDGDEATLTVTVPPDAPVGSWQTFYLTSFRLDADGDRGPPGDDYGHSWVVGVHVVAP